VGSICENAILDIYGVRLSNWSCDLSFDLRCCLGSFWTWHFRVRAFAAVLPLSSWLSGDLLISPPVRFLWCCLCCLGSFRAWPFRVCAFAAVLPLSSWLSGDLPISPRACADVQIPHSTTHICIRSCTALNVDTDA
jgi:hypothetical protein